MIEHRPEAIRAVEQWRLGDVLLDIRQDESDAERVWTRTQRALWWGDGRVVVLVSDPPHIRVFDSRGVQIDAFGAAGDGPGELRGPTWVSAYCDSVVVRDRSGLSIFDSKGTFIRDLRAPSESYELIGHTRDGWLFSGHAATSSDHSQPEVPQTPTAPGFVVQLSPDGDLSQPIATFERLLNWRVQHSLWGMLGHVATDGTHIFAMHPELYQVTAFEAGVPTRIIRAPVPRLPEFTERHFDVTRQLWGAAGDLIIQRDREAGRLGVPPAVSMLSTPDGDLWIRRTDDGPEATSRIWDVFDGNGIWQATVQAPAEFAIQQVRADAVLGIWTDASGVSSIRSYPLERVST